MLEYALKKEDVFDIIGCLQANHYYRGPDQDHDGSSGKIMIFRYPYDNIILYIKLKIWTSNGRNEGAVISFHQEGLHDV